MDLHYTKDVPLPGGECKPVAMWNHVERRGQDDFMVLFTTKQPHRDGYFYLQGTLEELEMARREIDRVIRAAKKKPGIAPGTDLDGIPY